MAWTYLLIASGFEILFALVRLNEDGEQFGEFVLRGRHCRQVVGAFQLGSRALVFHVGLNNPRKRLLEQAPVGGPSIVTAIFFIFCAMHARNRLSA